MFQRFDPEDPYRYLNDPIAFNVVHGRVFSIDNMTDEEVRQSIIDDLLLITMLEIEHKIELHFGMTRFLKWLPREKHRRVIEQMMHPEICGLIDNNIDKRELRIKKDHAILQAAMDYAGHWWDGFVMPDEGVLIINREAVDGMIDDPSKFEKLCQDVFEEVKKAEMDEAATAPIPETVQ